MESKLIVRLVWDHSTGCASRREGVREWNPDVRDFWLDTYDPKPHEKRSSVGDNRGNGYRWLALGCAWDSECGAKALVRVDSLEELINDALSGIS